jgi:ABC-2 type transport system permease protein
MSLLVGPLFSRTVASLRIRLLVSGLGLFAWGAVLPIIYATFGKELASVIGSNQFLSQFTQFGGGDVFSLTGSIALGLIHPITLLLMGIVAIGFPVTAIAGERQRGTLEVLLARPISRHALYATLFVAGAVFLAVLMAMEVAGSVVSAEATGSAGELMLGNAVLLWFNGWLLFVAFMSIAFAASVSFDRLAPALSITLAFVLVSYFLDVVGSLWPDAKWIQGYSMFNLVRAKQILEKGLILENVLVLAAIAAVAIVYAWIAFPRRDLAAPS